MKKLLFILSVFMLLPLSVSAQRIQQKLGRGVVVAKRSSEVLVSWRKLAQESENITYNVYKRKKGTTEYTKVNAEPIDNTNFSTSPSTLGYGNEVAVTAIVNGVESEKSAPFHFQEQAWNNVFFDIDFETTILTPNNYRCKHAYPMDLDGDGEYDAILADRHYYSSGVADPGCTTTSQKLQAYRLDGTHLWTMDVGPNVRINSGQCDMVLPYDINCDGKCEVIVKTSDGTRFWDAANNTWGAYANGSASADTDGDGIIDYCPSSKNPPYYISILDGETGKELYCSELKYSEIRDNTDQYSRTNRSDYMNDGEGTEYAFLGGKVAICYFDGVHPSLAVQCYNRRNSDNHHYYLMSWTFDWNNGVPSNWHHDTTWSFRLQGDGAAEFHQCRVADADGDGIDELFEGGYSWNPAKGQIAKPHIGHGDRFDLSDIDPDRPGMEVYAIQQSNLLGQVIYAAESGEHLQEWFLSSIGDVGRGRCIDVDDNYKGYEVFSMMGNLYSCKGDVIKEGSTSYPVEAIWWDGNLQRELLSSPGGSGYGTNGMITTYGGSRLIEMSKESAWKVHPGTAVRPAFVGDMCGDWREEVIMMKQTENYSEGLVGYATNIATDISMYTLLEDPAYALDCLLRGYYQSPNTSFYLGGGMPYPPLPPVMTADNRWKSGTSWSASSSADSFTSFDQKTAKGFSDGSSVIFDISGDNTKTINIEGTIKPSVVYLMNPKGHDYTFAGSGTLAGTMELWKSMQGTTTFNNNLTYTGKTVISEGTLVVNGTLAGLLDLRAKGSFGGVATVAGDVVFEGGLNYEGCRLIPGNSETPYGVMTFSKSLTIPGEVYIVSTVAANQASKILVNGDLKFEGSNTFTFVRNEETLAEGNYVIAECTGTLTADVASLSTRGLEGLNYDLKVEGKQIILVINATRAPQTNVEWTGNETNVWDYKSDNFSFNSEATAFVPGDAVVFNDKSANRTITINEEMTANGVVFDFSNGTYTLSGDGGIGGEGSLVKQGKGELKMLTNNNSYTGATIIKEGTLTVTTLANAGKNSTLGASSADAANFQLCGGTLKIDALNMATDRKITLTDTSTIYVDKSNAAISLTNIVSGTGYLIKDGPGQLNFTYSGVNPFAGIIVKQGKIAQGAWNATFGKSGSPMVLAGGSVQLLDRNNSSTRPILNHPITVVEGTENTVIGTTRGAINGSFLGKGQVTIVSTGVRSDIGANFGNFEGTVNFQGGNCRLMDATRDFRKTKVILDAASWMGHHASNSGTQNAVTSYLGELSSTATDCTLGHSKDTYEIGHLNTDAAYRGLLKAKSIVKVGTGVWTLYTAGSTSPITVSGGTLQPYNSPYSSTPDPVTTGHITVKSGGKLTGRGSVNSVSVQKGGILAAGYNGGYGNLKGAGAISLQAGATMVIKVGKTTSGSKTNDKFIFNGNTTHNNDTILIEVAEDRTLVADETITVFTGTGTRTGSYVLKTVSPGQNITWDDSALLSDGVLKVVSATSGINGVTITDDTLVDVYTTDGILLRSDIRRGDALNGLASGVYVVGGVKVSKK